MQKDYFDKVHKWGILWNIGALLTLICIPVAICSYLGAWPEIDALLSIMPKLMGLYWLTAIVEVITYVPLLGPGGAYLSFVTGNITNLKLPCGLKAMEQAKVRANTEEGEVISTIAISISAITTTVIIAVGVLAFGATGSLQLLTEGTLAPAFEYVLPALFGALGVVYISKNWKIAIVPVVLMLILFIAIPALNAGTVGIMVPVGVIFTIIVSRILYKKGLI